MKTNASIKLLIVSILYISCVFNGYRVDPAHYSFQKKPDVGGLNVGSHNVTGASSGFFYYNWRVFKGISYPMLKKDTASLDYTPIWESWKTQEEIFSNSYDTTRKYLLAYYHDRLDSLMRHYTSVPRLYPRFLTKNTTPQHYQLTDQNRQAVYRETLLNDVAFQYVSENKLLGSNSKVNFPAATNEHYGSLIIKVAWKLLSDEEIRDSSQSFHKSFAFVKTSAHQWKLRVVGLIGMHFMYKFTLKNIEDKKLDTLQWLWSTFSHVDIAPLRNSSIDATKHWLFYNPSKDALVNNPQSVPSQIEKLYKNGDTFLMKGNNTIEDYQTQNQDEQATFNGSVWKNYEQIGTQWLQLKYNNCEGCTKKVLWSDSLYQIFGGSPVPNILSNPVLEPFKQTTSCIRCHTGASSKEKSKPKDFVFFWSK